MPHTLAIDLGTTYFKAAVFNDAGTPVAIARRPTVFTSPRPGWAELPPQALTLELQALCQTLRQDNPNAYAHVAAVSFASQANSFLLLDADDQPLTPIIAWTDQRAADESVFLESFNALPARYEHTGIPSVTPGLAALNLHWLRRHHYETWRRARRFCLISDELTRWLSGAHVTEAGVAALTGLLDIHHCQWWPPALDHLGLDPVLLPEVVRAGTDAGPVTGAAAEALGLSAGTRVVVGCLDQYAGAIAAGNIAPGHVSETTGTVLAVISAADRFDPALQQRGVYQGPAASPGLYYRMVFSSVAGNLLEAYQREHAPEFDFAQLDQQATETLSTGSDAALDIPTSEATGRPVFVQPPATHGEAALAIMRSVAQRLNEHLDTLCGEVRPDYITCLGGAARSTLWRQLKERATGLPMRTTGNDEPTCLGAAICACESLAMRKLDVPHDEPSG